MANPQPFGVKEGLARRDCSHHTGVTEIIEEKNVEWLGPAYSAYYCKAARLHHGQRRVLARRATGLTLKNTPVPVGRLRVLGSYISVPDNYIES